MDDTDIEVVSVASLEIKTLAQRRRFQRRFSTQLSQL